MKNKYDQIRKKREEWQQGPLKNALARFPHLQDSPSRFYSPLDVQGFHFLEKVGFPGDYPFTAGAYPFDPMAGTSKSAPNSPGKSSLTRAALYSGYGAPEDTREYYRMMIARGFRQGPNLPLDLPTQCGYDSDNPLVEGEVGRVGVSVDTLRDLEVIYEPYRQNLELDRIASNFTINAPAIYFIALYAALAQKRGISFDSLRATPQNDILKEYIARGTYIFPPRPSMRLFRDTLVFLNRHMPKVNINSMGGYHIREAGATRIQDLSFSMANACAYIQEGLKAGLTIDDFASRLTFNTFGGSMEFLKEIAFHRAARRMYARIMKERFGARNPRSMVLRAGMAAHIGPSSTTKQRPLNNLTRSVIGAIAGALSGGPPRPYPPFDEPMSLGWSMEARQLSEDANRILAYEARLLDVPDPFAGSYCIEALTEEIENAAWDELEKIDHMGGAVAAIEDGYMQREISKSAYECAQMISRGERLIVGVNCFTGEQELEVETNRMVPHPYDPEKRARAEELQITNLRKIKRSRNDAEVRRLLGELKQKAQREDYNLVKLLIECARAYVTVQEVCDVFRDVFGEYTAPSIF